MDIRNLINKIQAAFEKATQEKWNPKQVVLRHTWKPVCRCMDRDTSDEELACLLRNNTKRLLGELRRLLNAEEQFNIYRDAGLEIFASPCEQHSGDNAPTFEKYVERYGRKCTLCLVDDNENLQQQVNALLLNASRTEGIRSGNEHLKEEVRRLMQEADAAIKGHANSGGMYARGLASEGYAGGYRDAMNDIILLMNGGVVTRRIR